MNSSAPQCWQPAAGRLDWRLGKHSEDRALMKAIALVAVLIVGAVALFLLFRPTGTVEQMELVLARAAAD